MADTTESHPVAKLQQESRDRKRHRLRSRVIVVRNCTFVLGPAGPALRAERSHDILLEGTHGEGLRRVVSCWRKQSHRILE